MLKFNINYFLLAIALFIIEFLIAIYAQDDIIRPFIGDLLVVILLYCLVKSFIKARNTSIAVAVLLCSYAVEILQYFHIVNLLGLDKIKWATILIGTSFAWMDLLMYTLGIMLVLVTEYFKHRAYSSKLKHSETHIFI
ncbi:hypothetical protein ABIB40_001674 [Pedobacter sp. UYP30]|uniref:ribosomal maturation YjgA family protein n=1 Tax=Pedobacter sp. UYP30 TaxID=1756400 RepID=UPI003395E5F6